MRALILVGGFGTRLRPLTFTKPKPLVEFCNLPILEHQLAALSDVGVKEVVLAVSYKPEDMMEALKGFEAKYGMKVVCSVEEEPLGTAGPLALAKSILAADGEPFFVFNSDVTCEYPLKDLLDFHRKHGKEGTIMVTRVDEPSKYGVVVHDDAGRIQHFVEKPQTFVSNHINAGLYCLSPAILDRIPLKPTSIEKDIFPVMTDEGQLFAMVLPGYWMDIGQPKDYLTGMGLHLASLRKHAPARLAVSGGATTAAGAASSAGTAAASASSDVVIKGNVLIDASAKIGAGCIIGPDVVIGPGCVVEDGVRLERTTLLAGTTIKSHALVSQSIIGWGSKVGRWARVEGGAVFGEDVTIADEKAINGCIILPHKEIRESMYEKGKIVM